MRNIWWLLPGNRRRVQRAQFGTAAAIRCPHTNRGPCYFRIRPGDTRKSCWEVCKVCGLWLTCNC